jgi:hypothetical protein
MGKTLCIREACFACPELSFNLLAFKIFGLEEFIGFRQFGCALRDPVFQFIVCLSKRRLRLEADQHFSLQGGISLGELAVQ